tara:strand:- start:169 stop:516 length:348 start_codon:yes stop_codon:yes gene_type:complete
MAFKMKAGKEGPMKKNFPAAFKVDLDEVTVTAKAPRVAVLKQGYILKDGKYYKESKDPSLEPTKVNMADAIEMKRKSNVKTGGTTLDAMTGGVKTSMNDEINDVVIPTKRKTKEN